MASITAPSYDGHGLVNLIAHIERRKTGTAHTTGLDDTLAPVLPSGKTIVVVLFDGLGSRQLDHPRGRALAAAHVGDLDAPFPTTTTVSLATIATGLPPVGHGLIAYQLWNPKVGEVVNTIHMTTMWGNAIDQDHHSFLPGPNLWERMSTAGIQPVTIQPDHFDRTPLTLALYRGALFVPYGSLDDAVDRTIEASLETGRLVFLYIPHIDFAAHVSGQNSEAYAAAMGAVNAAWERLVSELPSDVALIATADHGHIDIDEAHKVRLTPAQHEDRILYGDARALFVRGDGISLARDLPADWVPFEDVAALWGPGPAHDTFEDRRPDGVLFAHDGYAIFHRRSNDRLVGHHGGLSDPERVVPLLVRS